MPLMADDHVVQTLPAAAPNQPLDTGIWPWTPGGDQDFFAPQVPHALPKRRSRHAIPIAKQRSRDLVPRKGLQHLLSRPRCGGMPGDIAGHDTAPLRCEDQPPKPHRVGHRRDDEESRDTRSCLWLCRNVFHIGVGGFPSGIRYCSTVDLATSMPRLRSAPPLRGDPHVGFARHIFRISSRTSLAMAGRPGLPR
jgi:hypothetical protein